MLMLLTSRYHQHHNQKSFTSTLPCEVTAYVKWIFSTIFGPVHFLPEHLYLHLFPFSMTSWTFILLLPYLVPFWPTVPHIFHISKPPQSFTTTAFVTAYEHHISINSFFIISHHLPTNLDLLVSHLKMSMFLLYWSVKALCINLSIVLLYLSTEHFSLIRSLTLSPHVIHAVATLSTPVYSTVFTR